MGMEKILKWLKKELNSVWKIILALLTIWGVYEYGYKHGKDICESELGALNKQFAILKDSLVFNAQISPSYSEIMRANLRRGTANPILEGHCVILYRDVIGRGLKRKAEILVKEADPQEIKFNQIRQIGRTWLLPAEFTSFTVEHATGGYNIFRATYSINFLGFYDDIENDVAKIIVYYKDEEFLDPKKDGELIIDSTILKRGDSLGILSGAVYIIYKNIESNEGRKWPVVVLSGKRLKQFRAVFVNRNDTIPFYEGDDLYALNFLGFVDTLTSDNIGIRLYKIKK